MPGVVYGHAGGLIGQFLDEPARTGSAHYIGGGENRWAMVHVDDIAELYVAALAAPAGSVEADTNSRRVDSGRPKARMPVQLPAHRKRDSREDHERRKQRARRQGSSIPVLDENDCRNHA